MGIGEHSALRGVSAGGESAGGAEGEEREAKTILSVEIKKQLPSFELSVQFQVDQERQALLGASGCGKSVTLKCIAGILTPDEGQIILDGVTLFDSAAGINLPPQRRHVGYLFQQYALFPHMTVEQNIAAAVADRRLRKGTAAELLRQFRLEHLSKQKPGQLSGGEQQRVALARILAAQPKALLLDEPFSALDSYLKYQLEQELTETLEHFPGPVVWVSHDRGEVFRNCKKVCVLAQGHSQGVQDREELFHNPGTEAAARLSGCKNYADVCAEGRLLFFPQWKITLDCGRTVPEGVSRVGVRSHTVRLAEPGETNAFACRVVRVTEDMFSIAVMLRPIDSAPDAPLLCMELEKTRWLTAGDQERVTVAIYPWDILLLHKEVL